MRLLKNIMATATLLLSYPSLVLAAPGSIPNPVGEGETITLAKIVTLVTDVVNVFLAICLTVVIAMIVYSGFRMATARENPKIFEEGKKSLTNAIIGLLVVLGVGLIVRTIGDFAVSPTSILR